MTRWRERVQTIELSEPKSRDSTARIDMTASCRDSDVIPKVNDAGRVTVENGARVQLMHNGLRVSADGYYGSWMTELIERCRGHHEPQEEVVFHELLKQVPPRATMLELGGYWAYYSLWFLKGSPERRAIMIEPDPANLAVGVGNAQLNDQRGIEFVKGFVGGEGPPVALFRTEHSGTIELPRINVPNFLRERGIEHLDILHCDAQGAELDVLLDCVELLLARRIDFVVISTHILPVNGEPLMHQRCLRLIQECGGQILAEHDVHESFSGDGLVVGYFGERPLEWTVPKLTYNRYSQSYFRNPLFDLAVRLDQIKKLEALRVDQIKKLEAHPAVRLSRALSRIWSRRPRNGSGQAGDRGEDCSQSIALIEDGDYDRQQHV